MNKKEILQAIQSHDQLEDLVYETTHAYCEKKNWDCLIDEGFAFEFNGGHVDVSWTTYTMGNYEHSSDSFPIEYLWEGVSNEV